MTRYRPPVAFASVVTAVRPKIATSSKAKSFSYPSIVSTSPCALWASFEDPSQLGGESYGMRDFSQTCGNLNAEILTAFEIVSPSL